MTTLTDKFQQIADEDALIFSRGIEREALRVTPKGTLASTPHPAALGSKLTHPKITTDFSESQLELITPVHKSAAAALDDLDKVHRFVYSELGDDLLWSASMPCVLQNEEEIPLAYYGESNLGKLKTTYRSGLGYRYGRGMQTICAVHYNFSLPDAFWQWLKAAEDSHESDRDFMTRRYFDLMRNFRRFSWLLTYLFGASPAVCNSFLRGREHDLSQFDEGTAYLPDATSLRSGNLGYQSDAQAENIKICFNSLDNYVKSLADAICQTYEPYERIGTKVGNEYRQVNASILQSEAEFYSSIRAKRVSDKGANFLACLLNKGVEYIEVRLLDVNPYLPLGIDETEINFLDTFLLYCLLSDSSQHDEQLCDEVRINAMKTVHEGRADSLMLIDQGNERSLREWGASILTEMASIAEKLDETQQTRSYSEALAAQTARINDAALTPSGHILKDMRAEEVPFFRFAMNKTLAHREHFLSRPLDENEISTFKRMAAQSVSDQEMIDSKAAPNFDDYLANVNQDYESLTSID